jgi:hypothetical protein
MNNKAVSPLLWIGIILIIVVVVAALALGGGPPATPQPTSGLQVQFSGVTQVWNDTVPQTLPWGNVAPSMSYTMNLTVTNLNPQTVNLLLLTTEPQGSHHTWPKNNTALLANRTATADLTLITDTSITAGEYTWLLLASNSTTSTTPTPQPTNPATVKKNCTIATGGVGAATIKVTNMNAGGSIILTPSSIPYTVLFTPGDNLKFEVTPLAEYAFNAWTFSDGTFPQNNPVLTVVATETFTVTANFLLVTGI